MAINFLWPRRRKKSGRLPLICVLVELGSWMTFGGSEVVLSSITVLKLHSLDTIGYNDILFNNVVNVVYILLLLRLLINPIINIY